MPPPIVDLANHIRLENPRNLFCLVEFGNHGNIVAFSSGKAMWSYGEKQWSSDRVYFYENDTESNKDGEERMTHEFRRVYDNYGQRAEHLTIFTAASPCSRVCATAICDLARAIADDKTIPVRTITILYHKVYHNSMEIKYGGVDFTLNKLNQTVGSVKIQCFQLHDTFIDPRTIHGTGHH